VLVTYPHHIINLLFINIFHIHNLHNILSYLLIYQVFGTLANMTIYDLPASSNWSKLLREYSLLNLFCKMLVPGMAQNDLLLEIVMLVSTIASDLQVIYNLQFTID